MYYFIYVKVINMDKKNIENKSALYASQMRIEDEKLIITTDINPGNLDEMYDFEEEIKNIFGVIPTPDDVNLDEWFIPLAELYSSANKKTHYTIQLKTIMGGTENLRIDSIYIPESNILIKVTSHPFNEEVEDTWEISTQTKPELCTKYLDDG